MDLLLYLIRKEEVDIYDVPISSITEQYIKYIEMLKNLDIDLAGSFLVMAATLMQIKSSMLLPVADAEQLENEDLSDPRAELIRQLLEYKKFKDAANLLDNAAQISQSRFHRPDTIIEKLKPDAEPEIDIDQVSVWDLLEAFDNICKATGVSFQIGRITDETPIDVYQIEILARLQSEGPVSFEKLFEARPNRLIMVGLFLALLELIRYGLISAESAGDTIILKALTDEPAEQAVQKIISVFSRSAAEAEPAAPVTEQMPSSVEQQPQIPIVELPAQEKKVSAEYHKIEPLSPERQEQISD
jgi:segregation and condensation protein A